MKTRSSAYTRGKSLAGVLFASPWLAGLAIFVLAPIIATLFLSFTNYNMINAPRWIGLMNFKALFTLDSVFWKSVGNTFYYMAGSVVLKVLLSLLLAVLLDMRIRGLGMLKTVYFLPVVLPAVPVMLLWKMLFSPTSGLINRTLAFFGIEGPLWLMSPEWAKPALIVMSLWGIGGIIVIFLAGLQDIPEDLYEAADLEGASARKKFARITMPLLAPVILFNLVTGFIGASQVFAESYVMTGGGPLDATNFANLQIYLTAFKQQQMGYASSMAWIMFTILVPITVVLFYFYRKRFEF